MSKPFKPSDWLEEKMGDDEAQREAFAITAYVSDDYLRKLAAAILREMTTEGAQGIHEDDVFAHLAGLRDYLRGEE